MRQWLICLLMMVALIVGPSFASAADIVSEDIKINTIPSADAVDERGLQLCPPALNFQNCVGQGRTYCQHNSFARTHCAWCHETHECIPTSDTAACHTWKTDFDHCPNFFYCPHDPLSFTKCPKRIGDACEADIYGHENCHLCSSGQCTPGILEDVCGHHKWYKHCPGYKPLPALCPHISWLKQCPLYHESDCNAHSDTCVWCHEYQSCNAYIGAAGHTAVCTKKGQFLYYGQCLSCYKN